MRLRSAIFSSLVLAALLAAAPAMARPCCEDCPSWPNLDWLNDPCARVCLGCGGGEALASSQAPAAVTLEQIFTAPGQDVPAQVCQ